MAKGEFVLNIGDDNVVLTRFIDGKVANAWLGSPDSAMAQEELGEALAEDPRGRLSVLIDTLDQSFKEEEIPRVSIFDRRRVLARHINMAFPGQNLRGARLMEQTPRKTLIYQLALRSPRRPSRRLAGFRRQPLQRKRRSLHDCNGKR